MSANLHEVSADGVTCACTCRKLWSVAQLAKANVLAHNCNLVKELFMTNSEKLMDMGAQCVAGDLIYKNKVLGSVRNGDLQLTQEGKDFLARDISDAVIKSETPKKAKKAKVEVVESDTVDAISADLDSLLSE